MNQGGSARAREALDPRSGAPRRPLRELGGAAETTQRHAACHRVNPGCLRGSRCSKPRLLPPTHGMGLVPDRGYFLGGGIRPREDLAPTPLVAALSRAPYRCTRALRNGRSSPLYPGRECLVTAQSAADPIESSWTRPWLRETALDRSHARRFLAPCPLAAQAARGKTQGGTLGLSACDGMAYAAPFIDFRDPGSSPSPLGDKFATT